MAIFSVFQVISLITFALFLTGLLNNLWSDKQNVCDMTYMFEYPQFVRIKVPNNEQFPQYGLYAYGEGRFTERTRKMRFDGIPVLFLPGNVGSYKQARSIASVALRKSIDSPKYNFHFDYFTVDYNDEMSGFYGGILEKQRLFASQCIEGILNLYNLNNRYPNNKPTAVILIGHSMGGVIAKSLLINPQLRSSISVILTLASPNRFPVINADYYMDKFYKTINEHWNMKFLNLSHVAPNIWQNKVLISIGGGPRDLLVPSALTHSSHNDISVLTTSIPGVWLSTDHLCIVWCKQLVLVINRFLFSLIDKSTRQLTKDTAHILRMGHNFFKVGETRNLSHYQNPIEFIAEANWHEDSRRIYQMTHENGVIRTWYYMVRLVDALHHQRVTFQVIDLDDKDWIFGCQAKYVHGQYRICKNGRHLSKYSHWEPSNYERRKTATIDLRKIRVSYPHWTHVILRIPPSFKNVKVYVDIHGEDSRFIQFRVPGMWNIGKHMIIKETYKYALTYNISLPGFDMLYQAFVLFVEPVNCEGSKIHTSARMHVPWSHGHEMYSVFTENERAPMKLRLLEGNPNLKNATQHVYVNLLLDPQCTYSVSIAPSIYDSLGQVSRHYSTSLPAYVAAISLLVLRHWAASMEASAPSTMGSSFHSALCGDYTKPYYPLLSSKMAVMLFVSVPFLAKVAPSMKIAATSSQNFLLLPLILYVIALGFMHLLGAALWCLLIFSGQIAHKIVFRIICRGGGVKLWDWAANALRKAPGAGGCLLVALASASCGAVALVMGAAFYFFLLTKMYEDYLEALVFKTIKKVAKKLGIKHPKRKNEKNDNETQNRNELNVNSEAEDENNVKNSDEEVKIDQDAKSGDLNISRENNDGTSEENVSNPITNDTEEDFLLLSLHFHFAMFFLWSLITILNIPLLLTWAHNFKYSKVIEPDPSYIPSIIMCFSAAMLWQIDVPKKNIKYYDVLKRGIYIMSIVVLIATPMAIYRLNYILPIVFAAITLHQTFSKSLTSYITTNSDDDSPAQFFKNKIRQEEGAASEESRDSASSLVEESTGLEKFKLLKEKIEASEVE